MFLTGPWSIVYAVDVRKGEIIWVFDPEVPRSYGEKGCCGVVNRGLAVYKGTLYLGAFDGRLIAINAHDGSKRWEVLTVDQDLAYTITGAPRIVNGKVIIGNGGAEYGVRGYVTAYDAESGEPILFRVIRRMGLNQKRWKMLQKPGPVNGGNSVVEAQHGMLWHMILI